MEELVADTFKVKLKDGKVFEFPHEITKISTFFHDVVDNMQEDEDNCITLEEMPDISGDIMQFLFDHLKLHDFSPPGVTAQTIQPELVKNLHPKDYDHVKHLEGIENIEKVAKYIKALNVLNIFNLRQVYICIIATEYTLEGRTIEDMNKKFASKLPLQYQSYEELTQERMDQLNKMFPFMTQKENLMEEND